MTPASWGADEHRASSLSQHSDELGGSPATDSLPPSTMEQFYTASSYSTTAESDDSSQTLQATDAEAPVSVSPTTTKMQARSDFYKRLSEKHNACEQDLLNAKREARELDQEKSDREDLIAAIMRSLENEKKAFEEACEKSETAWTNVARKEAKLEELENKVAELNGVQLDEPDNTSTSDESAPSSPVKTGKASPASTKESDEGEEDSEETVIESSQVTDANKTSGAVQRRSGRTLSGKVRAETKDTASPLSEEDLMQGYYSNLYYNERDGKWYALSCINCGANASAKLPKSNPYFNGLHGLAKHFRTCVDDKKITADAVLDLCCRDPISEDEIERVLQSGKPEELNIKPFTTEQAKKQKKAAMQDAFRSASPSVSINEPELKRKRSISSRTQGSDLDTPFTDKDGAKLVSTSPPPAKRTRPTVESEWSTSHHEGLRP